MTKNIVSCAFAAVLFLLLSGPVMALELLMVERDGCSWCQRWHEEIGPVYPRTQEGRRAPLYRADLYRLPSNVSFRGAIVYTPTFVLIDNGRELGRITGYAGEEMFWGLLGNLLEERDARGR